MKRYAYKLVAIGGTFDRLHRGHRYFIAKAFEVGERVVIGLTSDEYANSKLKTQNSKLQLKTQIFEQRKKQLEEYLEKEKLILRTDVVKIDHVYGPAATDPSYEAIIVTRDSRNGAILINSKRKENNIPELKIIQIPLIVADDRMKIASTRIRHGEIDRKGEVYLKILHKLNQIHEKLRLSLKQPQGILLAGRIYDHMYVSASLKKTIDELSPILIITVGDEVTKLANQLRLSPGLSIVDFRVERKKKYRNLEDLYIKAESTDVKEIIKVKNPAGVVRIEMVEAIDRAYKKMVDKGISTVIIVDGEEDLAGIPAILLAPLGSIVLYGQPRQGVVVVYVTEEKKKELVGKTRALSGKRKDKKSINDKNS